MPSEFNFSSMLEISIFTYIFKNRNRGGGGNVYTCENADPQEAWTLALEVQLDS